MTDQEAPVRPDRIVVGVDGSPPSELALRWAVDQARLTGQIVHAVIAWEFPLNYGASVIDADIDWAEQSRTVLKTAVDDVLGGAGTPHVEQEVHRGNPAGVLLDAAAGAGLLVVGSRGRGGFTGMLLGSVSQHLVTHAPCPVLVVPSSGHHRRW